MIPMPLKPRQLNGHRVLCNYYFHDTMLVLSGLIVSEVEVLNKFVELLTKFSRFVGVDIEHDSERKEGREVAAAAAVVVALPSVDIRGGEKECVICNDEMKRGTDVCELPCAHLFHWMCILPWLRKTNTCPCCRYRLPSDDISIEIQQLWEVLLHMGTDHSDSSRD